MNDSLAETLEQITQNGNASFAGAKSLPPAAYHDPEFLVLEIERLFRKDWICLGRCEEMPKPGDYLSRDIVDAPVFSVRQRDNSIKAFANVCAHRSSRLLHGAGHVSRISCPYHSWTYELDGQLIGAPFMDQTPGEAAILTLVTSAVMVAALYCVSDRASHFIFGWPTLLVI